MNTTTSEKQEALNRVNKWCKDKLDGLREYRKSYTRAELHAMFNSIYYRRDSLLAKIDEQSQG